MKERIIRKGNSNRKKRWNQDHLDSIHHRFDAVTLIHHPSSSGFHIQHHSFFDFAQFTHLDHVEIISAYLNTPALPPQPTRLDSAVRCSTPWLTLCNRYSSCHFYRVSLSSQKRLAAAVLKCGQRKIWLDPNEVTEIANANSRKYSIWVSTDSRTKNNSGFWR